MSNAPHPDDHAILVGIDLYPGLQRLKGPERDVRELEGWLVDEEGGGLEPEHVVTLVTSQFHGPERGQPTSATDARPSLADFARAFGERHLTDGRIIERGGRRLYLYFSGHGYSDAGLKETALYTANATEHYAEHIAGTAYAEWTRLAALYDEIVLWMDCCRGRKFFQYIQPPMLQQFTNAVAAANVRWLYGYASQPGIPARERPLPEGGPVRGVFTYALIDALNNADGTDGWISGSQLKDHVLNRWKSYIGDETIGEPHILPGSNREVQFRSRARGVEVCFELSAEFVARAGAGTELLVESGPERVVRRLAIDGASVRTRLDPGYYSVRLDGADRKQLFEAAGERIDVRL